MNVTERFLKYISFDTASDENSPSCPSTESQLVFADYLANELKSIGLSEVCVDENGYVYGAIPTSEGREGDSSVGFIAHMDTVSAVPSGNIKPAIVRYNGGDIPLASGECIRLCNYPTLSRYIGGDIIVTDGTTLLGADDKAGIAEILTACEYIIAHPEIPHGRIPVCITPDEEIYRGADRFDLKRFNADWAYTVDGGELGEIVYENFNAASAKITVHGRNIHTGSSKNKMKNAMLLAVKFINMLPEAETPSHTEGYEGFYHLFAFEGNESSARLNYMVRDHDKEKFEARKEFIAKTVDYLNAVYGENTFEAEIKDSYYNMRERIMPHFHIVDSAVNAMTECGIEPVIVPFRGGTDGAKLSFAGLPCPNLSTGGANFHGVHEFIPVRSMEKMAEVIAKLMKGACALG